MYDKWKQESPELPEHFCMICNVEISNGELCRSEDCEEEYILILEKINEQML